MFACVSILTRSPKSKYKFNSNIRQAHTLLGISEIITYALLRKLEVWLGGEKFQKYITSVNFRHIGLKFKDLVFLSIVYLTWRDWKIFQEDRGVTLFFNEFYINVEMLFSPTFQIVSEQSYLILVFLGPHWSYRICERFSIGIWLRECNHLSGWY